MSTMLDMFGEEVKVEEAKTPGQLAKDFIAPPFSVLDTKQEYWQERKRAWLTLGIQSELGRSVSCQPGGDDTPDYMAGFETGTSIFDPVLCELMYTWFAPPGGLVLDPFAGGSVRGIVAAKLGLQYYGCELSRNQVAANAVQGKALVGEATRPVWANEDSINIGRVFADRRGMFGFMFSCPPYYNLEVYSNDERDLSAIQTYPEFIAKYGAIISASCKLLAPDCFACFVVSDVRAPSGEYYGFVKDTIDAFQAAGLKLYNEAILLTSIGTLPMRSRKQMEASRKLGRAHQNVLVFLKGDAKAATAKLGAIDSRFSFSGAA